jgi:hypothetical protein
LRLERVKINAQWRRIRKAVLIPARAMTTAAKTALRSPTKAPQATKKVGVTKKAGAMRRTKTWNMTAGRVTSEVRRAKKTKKTEPPRSDRQTRQQ